MTDFLSTATDFFLDTDHLVVLSNLLVTLTSLGVVFASFAVYAATLRALSRDERKVVQDLVRHPVSRKHRKTRAELEAEADRLAARVHELEHEHEDRKAA